MADRSDFAAALLALAAEERVHAGLHPEPEEIAVYADGELSADRAEALRDHFAVCTQCADLVLDYAEFEPEPATGAAARDEVADAYRRVQRRLGRPVDEPMPVAGGGERPYRAAAMPWLLLAAGLAAVALGFWGWSQHRALALARGPQVNVATLDLQPVGSDRVRGETSAMRVDLAAGATLFLAMPSEAGSGPFAVRIVDAEAHERWSLRGAERHPVLGNLSLYLPPGSLPPGSYEIRVFSESGAAALTTYRLDVR